MRRHAACLLPFFLSVHAWVQPPKRQRLPTTAKNTQLYMIANLFDGGNKQKQDSLPRDVKDAVQQCREATQEALQKRISRMAIDFPVGTRFGVEATSSKKKKMSSEGTGAPTRTDLERSDRELARLFVDMFQPVGGQNIAVVFRDAPQADQAKKGWKGDPSAACRITSIQRSSRKSKSNKKTSKGFAAKLAAELEPSDDTSGPFGLPDGTEVALFVNPGPKELPAVQNVCDQVGMGTLVVLLNARVDSLPNYGSAAAKQLFTEDFETVFSLGAAASQDVAPNCLLYRTYPRGWILARKPPVGPPKTLPVPSTTAKPTPAECQTALEALELSPVEKGVEDMVENMATWFR